MHTCVYFIPDFITTCCSVKLVGVGIQIQFEYALLVLSENDPLPSNCRKSQRQTMAGFCLWFLLVRMPRTEKEPEEDIPKKYMQKRTWRWIPGLPLMNAGQLSPNTS